MRRAESGIGRCPGASQNGVGVTRLEGLVRDGGRHRGRPVRGRATVARVPVGRLRSELAGAT